MGFKVLGWVAALALFLALTLVGARLFVVWARGGDPLNSLLGSEGASPTPGASQELVAGVDSDGDGLEDSLEDIYRSDPNNPDTDGDGTSDGDEVAAQRDPTVPGPNDSFNIEAASKALQEGTYTKEYIAGLPPELSREEFLDKARLEAFVEEHRASALVEVTAESLTVTAEDGVNKAVVEKYLDTISASHNPEVTAVTSDEIDVAYRAAYQNQESAELETILAALTKNVEILQATAVPASAVDLHVLLLSASTSLRDNVALLLNMDTDFVGGLIGARNIEVLGADFAEVAKQVAALEKKWGIK